MCRDPGDTSAVKLNLWAAHLSSTVVLAQDEEPSPRPSINPDDVSPGIESVIIAFLLALVLLFLLWSMSRHLRRVSVRARLNAEARHNGRADSPPEAGSAGAAGDDSPGDAADSQAGGDPANSAGGRPAGAVDPGSADGPPGAGDADAADSPSGVADDETRPEA